MSTIRTANIGPLTGNTASVVDPSTPAGGSAAFGPLVSYAAVASTSGTVIDFIGIPSWVRRITIILSEVSTNGSSFMRYQIGSGSIDTSGYTSTSAYLGSSPLASSSTSGFDSYGDNGASITRSGILVFYLAGSNNWVFSGNYKMSSNYLVFMNGQKTLTGSLDRVRITTVNGTDTFDAGTVNCMYE